jgi:hypothetical protein
MKNRHLAATLLVLAAVVVCTFGLPAHADRLYWTRTAGDTVPGLNGYMASVRPDGTAFLELLDLPEVLMGNLTVDPVARRVSWIENAAILGDQGVRIVSGDGSTCLTLDLEGTSAWITLDVAGGKIYWVEDSFGEGNGVIKRANLDFTAIEVLIEDLDGPSIIDLDVPGGKMYWYDFIGDQLMRANLDGSGVEQQFIIPSLARFQIDSAGQKIYWTTGLYEGLTRADFDGSNPEDLAPQVRPVFAADVEGGIVYWREGGGFGEPPGMLKRANLIDGSNEDIVLDGFDAEANHLILTPDPNVIQVRCDALVPAVGIGGAVLLVLLFVGVGTWALRR